MLREARGKEEQIDKEAQSHLHGEDNAQDVDTNKRTNGTHLNSDGNDNSTQDGLESRMSPSKRRRTLQIY